MDFSDASASVPDDPSVWATVSVEITFLRLVQLVLTLGGAEMLQASVHSIAAKSLCEDLNKLWQALDSFLINSSSADNAESGLRLEVDKGIAQQLHLPLIHAFFLMNNGPALAASPLSEQQSSFTLPVVSAGSPRPFELRTFSIQAELIADYSIPSAFHAFCQRHQVFISRHFLVSNLIVGCIKHNLSPRSFITKDAWASTRGTSIRKFVSTSAEFKCISCVVIPPAQGNEKQCIVYLTCFY
jgi:hypothetical protein